MPSMVELVCQLNTEIMLILSRAQVRILVLDSIFVFLVCIKLQFSLTPSCLPFSQLYGILI